VVATEVATEVVAVMEVVGTVAAMEADYPAGLNTWISVGVGSNRVLLRSGLISCLLFCLTLSLVSYGSEQGYSEQVARGTRSRNLTLVAEYEQRPVLRITCEYVGKAPGDPGRYRNSHDYRAIDTDFYRIDLHNLTNEEIMVEGVSYRLEYGRFHGQPYATAESIESTWGSNRIQALSSLSRANNFVYARKTPNTLFKLYQFRFADSSDGKRSFSAEVPLVYLR
jgi:hypothetical protein